MYDLVIQPPVITIDGLSGSGKGTIALRIAKALRWNILDSGVIYRAVAWALSRYKIPIEDKEKVVQLIKKLRIVIKSQLVVNNLKLKIICNNHDITKVIRNEKCGNLASKVAVLSVVRKAFLQYQRNFRRWPGLVSDGRDMGTVVFPCATLKFYFSADIRERVYRRYRQLQKSGINASIHSLRGDLEERDLRDVNRTLSSARPAVDALVIDTTALSIEEVFITVMQYIRKCAKFSLSAF
ncbi:(d)CMP kinase [Coxiella endosymbiont of Amblyomma americanum]|uniref:(d)CMP kinase n=1 Tax=Coxiella endosymbiont of Amblyomma americanum TaxID=325775 RepID=UPI00057E9549|nr:(d)CMP kinase [Coxiella endosymbiont of Amblyomma americanum]AJC50649.1 cytidylate kinase [Coxiella endosymbiont of Amblyomma americanum]